MGINVNPESFGVGGTGGSETNMSPDPEMGRIKADDIFTNFSLVERLVIQLRVDMPCWIQNLI